MNMQKYILTRISNKSKKYKPIYYIGQMFNYILNWINKPVKLNILVLGFYNRDNLGDELYKKAIPLLFKTKHNFTFVCTDDINKIPSNTDIVICGGGDIINEYFMEKVKCLIKDVTIPIYALSVGVQKPEYLYIFDHVFVRSSTDYKTACIAIGTSNVTLMADCVFLLKPNNVKKNKNQVNIGISLAQPVINKKPELVNEIISLCKSLLAIENLYITFFAFNKNNENNDECDVTVINNIVKDCNNKKVSCVSGTDILKIMNKMNINICMRYHACVVSILSQIPFITISDEAKVLNLLKDYQYGVHVTDASDVLNIIYRILSSTIQIKVPNIESIDIEKLISSKKYKLLKAKMTLSSSFEDNVKDVSKILNIPLEYITLPKSVNIEGLDNLTLARLLCYKICGNMESECIWGLSSNLSKNDFILYDALKYVYTNSKPEFVIYYPPLTVERRCSINIEPYLSKNHRAGWKYVVDNLVNLYKKDADIFIDSYVDKTFHWGYDVNKMAGIIPYTKPWIGFIHHTFSDVSPYNVSNLFDNEIFNNSLKCCKGLIVLSHYLAKKMKGLTNVPIFVLYHPTEFVEKPYMFKYKKFIENKNRKIIQIGAWLRRPFSIFKLEIDTSKIIIKKAALQGNNMNVIFCPDKFTNELIENNEYTCDSSVATKKVENKLIVDINGYIKQCKDSVEIIQKLDNKEYDVLLSQNIVFLDLVDCSAVNTVIECMARNTPLIVNRHPALEEVLGKDYPGFYTTLHEATKLLSEPEQIKYIYKHLKLMDKSAIKIETFMENFQKIICSIKI